MTRVAVALAVVIALAAGVWMLWPDDERAPSTTTTVPVAASSSTASTPAGSTTTPADDHVVETVEEAEEILRSYWFGWFEGIFDKDEQRIREVVLLEEQVDSARDQFGEMTFDHRPDPESFTFTDVEILESTPDCVAVWARTTADFRSGSSEGVHVMRRTASNWKLLSYWVHRGDLWHQDCVVPLP